ncbi:MAG TPA: tRNA lysidine(34) synthetase TilS [Streptosporangiaceae bacterium]|nr:tRNA lysidine(34) synthetase TilS [Streptosporangiaceae bacterium]
MGPHPAVAAVRLAVRRALAGLEPGQLVLAACSGGADSLALAAGLAFEAPRLGLRAGGVTVDHGLQPGSAEQARRVVAVLGGLGLDPVREIRVTVAGPGEPGYRGPEAAARAARYAALEAEAQARQAAAILLGHTLDDQAETVLLGLARGSGARSLAGMAPRSGCYLRPLLAVRRAQTAAACTAQGLVPWADPHNTDPGYARVRVRERLLPALEAELGPGVAEALARTARQLRRDAAALDELAAGAAGQLADGQPGLPAAGLEQLPAAVRARVLRDAALAAGVPGSALAERHIAGLDALVTDWHGQRWVDLPGGVRGQRRCGRLIFRHSDVIEGT